MFPTKKRRREIFEESVLWDVSLLDLNEMRKHGNLLKQFKSLKEKTFSLRSRPIVCVLSDLKQMSCLNIKLDRGCFSSGMRHAGFYFSSDQNCLRFELIVHTLKGAVSQNLAKLRNYKCPLN